MNRRIALAISLVVFMLAQITPVAAATQAASCEATVAKLNYRTRLLASYKNGEDSRYVLFRQRWALRVSSAAQWLPKDAQKLRAELYQYDALHQATNREINNQIKNYAPLEAKVLDCSDAGKAAVAERAELVRGVNGKKVVGGNAKIGELKRKETEYQQKTFNKDSQKMMQKLVQEKRKHPVPRYTKLQVTEAKLN